MFHRVCEVSSRRFEEKLSPTGVRQGNLGVTLPLINTKSKRMKPWTHTASSFPWVIPGKKRQNIWSSFIYSFFYAQPFDQELRSSMNLFYLHTTIRPKYMALFFMFFLLDTTIRPKYMVLLYLFFLLYTTIQPKIKVLINLFVLFTHDHSTKIYGPLSFILSFVHDHSTKNYGLHRLIYFICTPPFDQNMWSIFIYSFFCARRFN